MEVSGEGEPEEWRDGEGGRVKGKMKNLSVIPSKLNAQDLFGAVPQTAGAVMKRDILKFKNWVFEVKIPSLKVF